jgi:hypothetical protein
MLIITRLQPYARKVVYGTPEKLEEVLYSEALSRIDPESFRDQRVVVKGCSNLPVPVFAYTELARILAPVVRSIMYGEPCSTVPVFKRKD